MITIILIIFFFISIFVLFPLKHRGKRRNLYVIIGFILILLAAFRDGNSVADYDNYLVMYDKICNGITVITDPTFILIANIANFFGNPLFIFIIYAIIGVSLKLIAIHKLTELWLASLVIYLSNFFILHEMTQIRAGVAAGLLLLCIKPIYERNWKQFLALSALAFFFHASAIIILPLWILGHKNPRKLLLAFSVPVAYLIYFSKINLIGVIPISGIQEKIILYQMLQEQGTEGFTEINVFNMVFLAKILIFYLLLWKYEVITEYNKYAVIFMKIFCVSLISFPVFAVMPVMGFRISELFGVVEILVIPLLYYVFLPRIVSRSIIIPIGLTVMLIQIYYANLIQS